MAGHSIFITDDSGLSFDLAPEDELEELEDQVGGEQSEPTQRTRHFANIGLPAPDATTGPNYRPSDLHTNQGLAGRRSGEGASNRDVPRKASGESRGYTENRSTRDGGYERQRSPGSGRTGGGKRSSEHRERRGPRGIRERSPPPKIREEAERRREQRMRHSSRDRESDRDIRHSRRSSERGHEQDGYRREADRSRGRDNDRHAIPHRRDRNGSVERSTDFRHSCVSTREGLESIRHTSAARGRDGHSDSRRQLRGGERGESDRDGNHEGDEERTRRVRRGRSNSRERSAERYTSARRRHSPPPDRERASTRELHRVERGERHNEPSTNRDTLKEHDRREHPTEHSQSTKAAVPPPPPPTLSPPPPILPSPPFDEGLDFFSTKFDALRALYARGLTLPNVRALPLDNLYKCRALLPAEDPDYRPVMRNGSMRMNATADQTVEPNQSAMPKPPLLSSIRDRSEFRRSKVADKEDRAASRAAAAESVIARIATASASGPLVLLKRAFDAGGTVRVVTRHGRGVRGTAIGTLRAFDRYFNMVLHDVEEVYTVLLKVRKVRTPDHAAVVTAVSSCSAEARAKNEMNTAVQQNTTGGGSSSSGRGAKESDARGVSDEGSRGDVEMEEVGVDEGRGLKVGGGGGDSERWVRKQDTRRRKLRQVFLRGDNVVLVTLVQDGGIPGGV